MHRLYRNLTFTFLFLTLGFGAAGLGTAHAGDVTQSEDFALETWYDINDTDGPVTIHRIRLERKEGRVTKSSLFRPYNKEYLETLSIQIEYSNEADRKWDARVEVNWVDEDGEVIDGFSGNETIDKKSARKLVTMSVSTLKYGISQAKTLNVEVHYEP